MRQVREAMLTRNEQPNAFNQRPTTKINELYKHQIGNNQKIQPFRNSINSMHLMLLFFICFYPKIKLLKGNMHSIRNS